MYIGVWPELHLAKLVAALQEGQLPLPNASVDAPSDGRRSASPGPGACHTPSSASSQWGPPSSAATPNLFADLLRVPLARRVDVGDAAPRPSGRHGIGPDRLSAVLQQNEAERRRRVSQAQLPPIPRPKSSTPAPRQQPLPTSARGSAGERAHSQPRLWQPPLLGAGDPSPLVQGHLKAHASSPQPPSREASPRPPLVGRCPPRPHMPGAKLVHPAVPKTPPRLPPMSSPPHAENGSAADSSAGQRSSSLSKAQRGGPSEAVPIDEVPAQPLLPETPPWRPAGGNGLAGAQGAAKPSWLSKMRTQLEVAREAFQVEDEEASPESKPVAADGSSSSTPDAPLQAAAASAAPAISSQARGSSIGNAAWNRTASPRRAPVVMRPTPQPSASLKQSASSGWASSAAAQAAVLRPAPTPAAAAARPAASAAAGASAAMPTPSAPASAVAAVGAWASAERACSVGAAAGSVVAEVVAASAPGEFEPGEDDDDLLAWAADLQVEEIESPDGDILGSLLDRFPHSP